MQNIAILGRGSIGLLTALELNKRYPNIDITIYGKKNKYSASYAAGAMINILSEIDCFNVNHPLTKWKLKNRSKAIQEWDNLNQYLINKNILKNTIYTSFGTEMSIDKNSVNKVEQSSLKSIVNTAKEYSIDIEIENNQKKEIVLIKEENSIDSNTLLDAIDNYLKTAITVIDCDVKALHKTESENWLIEDFQNNKKKFDTVIIACGAWSENLISKSNDIELPEIQSFYGVGCALLVKSQLPHVKDPKLKEIRRTPNRGGTCGIHGVQRINSIYVGASSHVSLLDLKLPNPESIRTLMDGTEQFLNIDTYDLAFEIAMGYRPVTSDHVPIIGSLSKNLFCLYGTKRDGLTWAPYFSKYLINYLFGDKDNQWDELMHLCSPQRKHISAGDIDECIDSYLLTKEWEDYQHRRNFNEEKKKKLRKMAQEAHEFINRNSEKKIGLNPEIINAIYYRNCK